MVTEVEEVVERHLFTKAWETRPPGSVHDKFLHCWRPEVALIGGRGSQKTGHLIAADAISANLIHRGGVGYLTEQTNTQVEDTLLPLYGQFINPELYHIQGGAGNRDVVWTLTGAVTRLRSRQATARHKDPPFRGPSAPRGIGHDELAIDGDPPAEDKNPILISMAMLRGNAYGCRVKTIRYSTTPKRNWFYEHLNGLGIADNNTEVAESADGRAVAYYAKTKDVDPLLYQRLLERYSAEFVRQELNAEWVEAQGRVWDMFDFGGLDDDAKLWPLSNIHAAAGFDRGKPWVLGVDLGAVESSWLLCQPYPAVDRTGRRQFAGNVLVAIAEWTPGRGNSPHNIINEIKGYTGGGAPAEIWIGHDYKTPGGADSTSPWTAFQQAGWGEQIRTHAGQYTFSKDNQLIAASAAICNAAGERRYAVSKAIETHHPNKRGQIEMLRADEYPSKGDAILEKHKTLGKKNYEDSRDAMLYVLAGVFPPPKHAIG